MTAVQDGLRNDRDPAPQPPTDGWALFGLISIPEDNRKQSSIRIDYHEVLRDHRAMWNLPASVFREQITQILWYGRAGEFKLDSIKSKCLFRIKSFIIFLMHISIFPFFFLRWKMLGRFDDKY
jgi:hypothetical protein